MVRKVSVNQLNTMYQGKPEQRNSYMSYGGEIYAVAQQMDKILSNCVLLKHAEDRYEEICSTGAQQT
jgi:hypothetical protein